MAQCKPVHNLLSVPSTQSSLKLILLIDDKCIGTKLKFNAKTSFGIIIFT